MTARERRLNIGDSVLLLLPTENNKLTKKSGEVCMKSLKRSEKLITHSHGSARVL